MPIITPFIKMLKDVVGAFGELSPATKKTIVAVAGIIAAVGPLLVMFGALVSSIGSIISFFAAGGIGATAFGAVLTALTGPVGIAIAAIGALITAGVLLYKNWDKVKAYTIQAWESMKVAVLKVISSIMGAMETLYGWIPKIGGAVKASAAAARQALEEETKKMEQAKKNWYEVRNAGVTNAGFRQLEEESKQSMESIQISIDETIPSFDDLGASVSDAGGKATKAFDDLGASVSDAGGKATKAAEDTRAEWEKTADILSNRLEILRTEYEIAAMAAEEKSNKAEQLRLKLDHLSQQMNVQRELVAAIKRGYDEMVAAKGEDAEESQKLQLRLVQEIRAQAELEKQIRETTQALRDHIQQFNELAVEIDKVEKKYREDLVAAHEEYQRRVAEVNDKLIEDERRVQAEYEKMLDDRARALRDFVGLFDEVTSKDVSGEQLLKNLRGQVEAFENWQENIADLAAKGVDEGLIDELRQMGPKAGPEIAALNTLTDKQLQEYVALWRTKNQKARQEAVNQLQQQREEMQQKLMEIRQAANEQLELYRAEWEKKNAEIRKNAEEELKRIQDKFNETAEAGTKQGMKLILNFAQGMESQFDRLRQAVEEARAIAAELDPTMRHSPSLVDKVRSGLAEILAAYQDLARKIQNINLGSVSMPALAGAGGSVVYTYNNDNRVINITVQDGEDLLRTLHRLGVRIP